MGRNRVVNIVNFIRGVEPRRELDLVEPVREEIYLNKKYGFDNTFLIQYDAMCSEEITDLLKKEQDEHMELGIWLELARELVESIGVKWEGRWDWDWHVNPGFLIAYTKEEKMKLIDRIMGKFFSVFGCYPRSAGSFILDSDSVKYLKEKYRIEAVCICREQWGTDGYTLWGGYYNGPYYPCEDHILHPAQSVDKQISVPVFRMLGPDPIYCYSEKAEERCGGPGYELYTLEPSYPCGADKKWIEWYFKNFTEREDMGYSYTQTGQENSFGWEMISKGLPMQMEYLDELQRAGKIRIEKLCDSGSAFSQTYPVTPLTVYSALDDWDGNGRQSVWCSSRYYRVNIYCDGRDVLIRDLHLFDETCRDPYLNRPCREKSAVYETLPVMDGLQFGDNVVQAGFVLGQGRIRWTKRDGEQFLLALEADGRELIMTVTEKNIKLKSEEDFSVSVRWSAECKDIIKTDRNTIHYCHGGVSYCLKLEAGRLEMETENSGKIISDDGQTGWMMYREEIDS